MAKAMKMCASENKYEFHEYCIMNKTVQNY